MRDAFEAWARKKTDHFKQDSKGTYVSHWTRVMWEAWVESASRKDRDHAA